MERLGREVERELKRRGNANLAPLAELTAAWPSVVGDAVARQAWPLRISRDGTLHVATSSATWAQELALLGDEILERLRSRLGTDAPAALKCAPGPIPEPEGSDSHTTPALSRSLDVPPEVRSEAAAAASAIDDPELRELVARAARASIARARSGRTF
jgi:hypothetical protein